MLVIVTEVNAPGWAAQGIREHLAMCLERFGDVRIVEVREVKKAVRSDGQNGSNQNYDQCS